MITAEINQEGFNNTLQNLYDSLMQIGWYEQADNLIKTATKGLCRKLVNFTPPMKAKGMKSGMNENKAAGEGAIRVDLGRLFSEANATLLDRVVSEHGTQGINAWVTDADGTRTNLLWGKVDYDQANMEITHGQNRDGKGRVKKYPRSPRGVWLSRSVVPEGNKDPFVKKKQLMVGRWKSCWAKLGAEAGDKKYPQWIKRHFSTNGNICRVDISKINDHTRPSVAVSCSAPGVGRTRQDIHNAVQSYGVLMGQRIMFLFRRFKHRVDSRTVQRVRDTIPPFPDEE